MGPRGDLGDSNATHRDVSSVSSVSFVATPLGDTRLSDEELRIGVELERQFKEQGHPDPDRSAYDELMRRRQS